MGSARPGSADDRLVLLPGLGADERLFAAQRAAFPGLSVPSWPTPRRGESLRDFARRVAGSLPAGEAPYVGGASLGGMVALEMAGLLRPKAVLLIGSCRSPRGLARWIRALRPLARSLPACAYRPRHWWLPFVLPRLGGQVVAEQRELFWAMLSRVPASFLKWGVEAILSWEPTPVDVPVLHLHGSRDRLIPLRNVAADRVVEGAGHLLTLTHPEEVNRFLGESMTATR